MFRHALSAALLLSTAAHGQPTRGPTRLPPRPPARTAPAPEPAPELPRVPIDLGPGAQASDPPQSIDILIPPPAPEPATPAVVKECEDEREAGIVAGEIVVCGDLSQDPAQFYSGSRDAWEKAYAERTQNAGTLPPPDVAGPGIFRGPATVGGLCVIGPCPKDAALIIDLAAIPAAPAGSDADRAGNGLTAREDDNAPLSDEDRRRVEAELGLPQKPAEVPKR